MKKSQSIDWERAIAVIRASNWVSETSIDKERFLGSPEKIVIIKDLLEKMSSFGKMAYVVWANSDRKQDAVKEMRRQGMLWRDIRSGMNEIKSVLTY